MLYVQIGIFFSSWSVLNLLEAYQALSLTGQVSESF